MTSPRAIVTFVRPRRPDRSIAILLAAIVLACASWVAGTVRSGPAPGPAGGAAAGSTAGARPPVVPAPGGVAPIEGPGAVGGAVDGRLPLAERIAFWTERVRARPDDFLSLVQLATVHAERARATADLAAYDQALQLIERAIVVVPDYPPTIRARAAVRFAIHDFTGAAADAATVLAAAPADAAALGVLGDARLELGELEAARTAYDGLARVAPGPWLDVRLARLAYAVGDPRGALDLARRARAAAVRDDPADAPFYAYAEGEFARLAGDGATARAAFEAALAARPDDLAALVGLARVDAFDGRTAAAIAGLERAAAIAPQPETLALLGDLQAMSGDRAAAARQYATVRLTATLGALDGVVYDRQLILFELDHDGATEDVLAGAQAALVARADAAGHDLVAWALHRLGRSDEAARESDAARASGLVDARILYHAGAIALARGDAEDGRSLIRRALDLGPALDPLERRAAEALLAGG